MTLMDFCRWWKIDVNPLLKVVREKIRNTILRMNVGLAIVMQIIIIIMQAIKEGTIIIDAMTTYYVCMHKDNELYLKLLLYKNRIL